MKIEVDPQETTRAEAFSLWMTSPMPMRVFLTHPHICYLLLHNIVNCNLQYIGTFYVFICVKQK